MMLGQLSKKGVTVHTGISRICGEFGNFVAEKCSRSHKYFKFLLIIWDMFLPTRNSHVVLQLVLYNI